MQRIEIRPATTGEIAAITAIYAHAVRDGTSSYEIEPPTLDEMTRRHAAIVDAGFPYLVAVDSGEVRGYAYASAFRPRPAYRFIVEDSVYLAPGVQGQGIGTLLLRALIERVEALGFRQIVAVIGDGQRTSASVRLHERLGFRHSGRLEGSGFKHGRWLDTAFMQLSLNGGAQTPPDPDSFPEQRFAAGRQSGA